MLYYHTTYLEDWDWWTVKTPTQEEDLRSFLIEIINGDQEVFLDKYKDCRYVLAKYNYLRELMNKILIGRDERFIINCLFFRDCNTRNFTGHCVSKWEFSRYIENVHERRKANFYPYQ